MLDPVCARNEVVSLDVHFDALCFETIDQRTDRNCTRDWSRKQLGFTLEIKLNIFTVDGFVSLRKQE